MGTPCRRKHCSIDRKRYETSWKRHYTAASGVGEHYWLCLKHAPRYNKRNYVQYRQSSHLQYHILCPIHHAITAVSTYCVLQSLCTQCMLIASYTCMCSQAVFSTFVTLVFCVSILLTEHSFLHFPDIKTGTTRSKFPYNVLVLQECGFTVYHYPHTRKTI
jgi:hypothetical protein